MALATLSNLSQSAVDAAFSGIVGAAAYTPEDLATDLAAGVPTILGWVGAGIGGGIVLMLAFIGIRKGFGFFKSIGR